MKGRYRSCRLAALAACWSLAGAACGSHLARAQLEAANHPLTAASGQPAAALAANGQDTLGGAPAPAGSTAANAAVTAGGAAAAGPGTAAPSGPASTLAPAVAATGPAGAAGPKSEILLGSLGTASGVIGESTAIIPTADRAWVSSVNARGGLNGHRLRIIFADTGGDPGRALSLVAQMVEQDHVLAFMGLYTVAETPAVAGYLEQHHIPAIGAPGGSEVEDQSPMIFDPQQGADYGVSWGALLAVTGQSDKRKFAVLYCAEASSCANQDKRVKQFAPQVGVTVVSESQISIAAPDYTAAVLAAKSAGADVLCVLADSASIIRVAQSAHRQGWYPVVSGTYTVNNQAFVKAASSDTEGVLGMAATVPYSTSPLLADYLTAIRQYQPGEDVGGYGATAWVQGKLWERLASSFGEPVTRDQIFAGLYGLHRETLGGLIPPITFPSGPHGKVNLCGVPIKVSAGRITAPLGDKFVCAAGWAPA
jgi:branched-chain amino acid transport system substrate-binding protein